MLRRSSRYSVRGRPERRIRGCGFSQAVEVEQVPMFYGHSRGEPQDIGLVYLPPVSGACAMVPDSISRFEKTASRRYATCARRKLASLDICPKGNVLPNRKHPIVRDYTIRKEEGRSWETWQKQDDMEMRGGAAVCRELL